MALRRVHWIWIAANVLALLLLMFGALLATVRIELEPAPSYDGGPVHEVEIQNEGNVERTFEDSHHLKHGPVSWWVDGVQTGGGTYVDGELEGRVWSNYLDGTPAMEAWLVGGDLHGPTRTWHENGRLESVGTHVDAQNAGPWLYFDAQGDLDLEQSGYYVDGERVDDLPHLPTKAASDESR